MAHFAKIENGVVTQVIVVSNDDCGGGEFPKSEKAGQTFIASIGLDGEWLQTSYNANFRGKFAGIGDIFDGTNFDLSPEVKAEAAAQATATAEAAAKREAVLSALAAAAGLEIDEVKAALG